MTNESIFDLKKRTNDRRQSVQMHVNHTHTDRRLGLKPTALCEATPLTMLYLTFFILLFLFMFCSFFFFVSAGAAVIFVHILHSCFRFCGSLPLISLADFLLPLLFLFVLLILLAAVTTFPFVLVFIFIHFVLFEISLLFPCWFCSYLFLLVIAIVHFVLVSICFFFSSLLISLVPPLFFYLLILLVIAAVIPYILLATARGVGPSVSSKVQSHAGPHIPFCHNYTNWNQI